MKIRSYDATVNMLETFFESTLEDSVSVDSIYASWGRKTEDPIKNKAWLSSCLIHLKEHDLALPVKERRNSRNKIVGLRLTEKGKRVLGKKSEQSNSGDRVSISQESSRIHAIDHENMLRLIAQFKKDNPMFDVIFEIKLKE